MPSSLLAVPSADCTERDRILSLTPTYRRTLERLYQRRAAVDELIEALERYQAETRTRCVNFGAPEKC
jgi:hypothetical protein